jgi:hypothetical protein
MFMYCINLHRESLLVLEHPVVLLIVKDANGGPLTCVGGKVWGDRSKSRVNGEEKNPGFLHNLVCHFKSNDGQTRHLVRTTL